MAIDKKLKGFIDGATTLAKIRGLNTTLMPQVVVYMAQPGGGQQFQVVVGINEPSGNPVAINSLWVRVDVIKDPDTKEVLALNGVEVLKLKDARPAGTVENGGSGIFAAITDYNQSWVRVTSYEDVFSDPQAYYAIGFQGAKGDRGPRGLPGENATVIFPDYTLIIGKMKEILAKNLASIQIKGVNLVQGGKTVDYEIEATMGDGRIKIPAPEANSDAVKWGVTPSTMGSIVGGVFTAGSFAADKKASIKASYTFGDTTRTAILPITIYNTAVVAPKITSLVISTTTKVNDTSKTIFQGGQTEQFFVTAHYDDSSTKIITAADVDLNGTLVWSVTPALGEFSGDGLFTAKNVIIKAGPSNVLVVYTPTDSEASPVQDTFEITVEPNTGVVAVLTSISLSGPASVEVGSTGAYQVIGTYDDSSSAPITSGITWGTTGNIGAIVDGTFKPAALTVNTVGTITATVGTHTATPLDVTVTVPVAVTLVSVTVQGPSQVLSASSTKYSLVGNYSDSTQAPITSDIVWETLGGLGTIDSFGLLTAETVTTLVTGGQVKATYLGLEDVLNVDIAAQATAITIDHVEVHKVAGASLNGLTVGSTSTLGLRYYVNAGDTGATQGVAVDPLTMGSIVWSIATPGVTADLSAVGVFNPSAEGVGIVITADFTPDAVMFTNTVALQATVSVDVAAAPVGGPLFRYGATAVPGLTEYVDPIPYASGTYNAAFIDSLTIFAESASSMSVVTGTKTETWIRFEAMPTPLTYLETIFWAIPLSSYQNLIPDSIKAVALEYLTPLGTAPTATQLAAAATITNGALVEVGDFVGTDGITYKVFVVSSISNAIEFYLTFSN